MRRVLATLLALAVLASGAPGVASAAGGDRGAGAAGDRPGTGAPPSAPLPAPPGRTSLLVERRTGGFPDAGSIEPSMSASGRFVAFTSVASNLVANDEPGSVEVFVLDRQRGRITRAGLPDGVARNPGAAMTEPSIAADGSVVAYTYRPPTPVGTTVGGVSTTYVFAWNRVTGRTDIVSRTTKGSPGGGASQPSVSEDGRYVAYTTVLDQPGDKDDGQADVVRFDRRTGQTVLVSAAWFDEPISGIANAPSISGDGNLVAFASDGGDSVVDEDTGNGFQVYVRNLSTGRTRQVSVASTGGPPTGEATDPAISQDGRFVAFASTASNLTEVEGGGLFRRDLRNGTTEMVSVTPEGVNGNGPAAQPSISPDGTYVAWTTTATNLVPETLGRVGPAAVANIKSDVYLRDMRAGETILVSVSRDNGPSGGQSFQPAVGGNGRYVAFASTSTNLVRDDDNKAFDVFLRDLPPAPVINPGTLDLGSRAVGTESLPLAATLGNGGWTALRVTGASITGADRSHFRVVADGCAGRTLRRNESCTVSVVFRPTARGNRAATLAVADAFEGSPRTVRLRGQASQARLELEPAIGDPGIVTIAEGSGFPPSTPVRLSWSRGITPTMAPVVTDARGRFRVPVLVFHNDRTGQRELLAAPVDGTAFPEVAATMLVTRPSVVPPGFVILRLFHVPLVLVIRG